jgi:hypothetical protein
VVLLAHGLLRGLQLVQAGAQVGAVAGLDALAHCGVDGQGLEGAAKVLDHVPVGRFGQEQLQRCDFHGVVFGGRGCAAGRGACRCVQ